MAVEINCASCNRRLRIADEHLGRHVRCPGCRVVFIAEQIPDLEEVESLAVEPAEPATDAIATRPSPRPVPPAAVEAALAFPPVEFKAKVLDDPQRQLKGLLRATVTHEGLRLVRGRQVDLRVPRGTAVDHLPDHRLAVEIDGRRVTLAVVKFGSYQARLARDVAAFLDGSRRSLDPQGYRLEWYLYAAAALPLGIPVLTLGGAIPAAVGFGLAAGCHALAQSERMDRFARVAIMLGINLLAYGVLGMLLLGAALPANGGRGRQFNQGPVNAPAPGLLGPRNPARVNAPPFAVAPEPKPEPKVKACVISFDGRKLLGAEFLPADNVLVTVDEHKAVGYWDPATGQALLRLPEGASAALTPDGYHLLVGSGGDFRLRPLEDGNFVKGKSGGAFDREMLALSADGKRLASYKVSRGRVEVTSRETGAKEAGWEVGHAGALVTGLALAPDGKAVALTFFDDKVEVRNAASGEVIPPARRPEVMDRFRAVYSPDGKRFAAGSYALSDVTICDAADGGLVRKIETPHESPRLLAFSPDGGKLASGTLAGFVNVWDLTDGRSLANLQVNPAERDGHIAEAFAVTGLSFSPDGQFLVATNNSSARVWDVGNLVGAPVRRPASPRTEPLAEAARPSRPALISLPDASFPSSVDFAPDGKTLALAVAGGACLWDVEGHKQLAMLPPPLNCGVGLVAFSRDGKTLLAAGDGNVQLWDVATRTELRSVRSQRPPLFAAQFLPDGHAFVLGTVGGAEVWEPDATAGIELRQVGRLQVRALALSPDGKVIAGGNIGGEVSLWDATTRKRTGYFRQPGAVKALAFSPDGKTLAAGATDQLVRLWDLTRKQSRALRVSAETVSALRFTPDGEQLFVWGVRRFSGGDVIVLEVATGRTLRQSAGYSEKHVLMAFSADSRAAASIGERGNNTLRLWDLTQLPVAGQP